jgi:hypothetical protein
MKSLRLMLDRCRQLNISLNLKKCIFCTSFDMLIGHMVCKEGLLMDQVKIVAILEIVAPTLVKDLHATLGQIGNYRKFIQSYVKVVASLEKLLLKVMKYLWTHEC